MEYKKWLVSILICTYNAEKTIEATIKSCLAQTYKNFEILIHDDKSKDGTLNVIKKLNDERIKIIDSWKKLWPYKGLNFLLDHAKWEYIAIQDHDDIWHKSKLEKQVNYLNNNKEVIWCGTYRLEYYVLNEEWYIVQPKEKFVTHWVAHTSLIFRNSNKRYDTNIDYLCDWYFLKKILSEWKKVIYVYPEVLTLHYNKWFWKNYSNVRFKLKISNFKRYFDVQWYSLMTFIHFPIFLLIEILPNSLKNKLTANLIKIQNKVLTERQLRKGKNLKEMLDFLE